jgi:hypothetical protein
MQLAGGMVSHYHVHVGDCVHNKKPFNFEETRVSLPAIEEKIQI